MQDLKIVLVQADQRWENKSENYHHYSILLSGLNECVDLIILPEMFDTGFSMNTSLSHEWDENPSLNYLKGLSGKYRAAVYTSMMCTENGNYFNRGVFVYPDGHVKTYDKRKTFGLAGEDEVFTAGKEDKIVEYKGWKIQLQICYDLRFPEICRNHIKDDGSPAYDLLLYVANWPERRSAHWKTLLQARAIENQCFVAGVNRVGEDGKQLNYSGDSCIVDPLGQVEACDPSKEIIRVFKLSVSRLHEIRERLPFLKDR